LAGIRRLAPQEQPHLLTILLPGQGVGTVEESGELGRQVSWRVQHTPPLQADRVGRESAHRQLQPRAQSRLVRDVEVDVDTVDLRTPLRAQVDRLGHQPAGSQNLQLMRLQDEVDVVASGRPRPKVAGPPTDENGLRDDGQDLAKSPLAELRQLGRVELRRHA